MFSDVFLLLSLILIQKQLKILLNRTLTYVLKNEFLEFKQMSHNF
jgi:hypothetical protein